MSLQARMKRTPRQDVQSIHAYALWRSAGVAESEFGLAFQKQTCSCSVQMRLMPK
jgi:hypothetical protein